MKFFTPLLMNCATNIAWPTSPAIRLGTELGAELTWSSKMPRREASQTGLFRLRRLQVGKRENSAKDPGHSSKHGRRSFFSRLEISQLNEVFHSSFRSEHNPAPANRSFSAPHELRNQYRLAYVTSNPTRDGTWRRTDVVVKDAKKRGFKVRAKQGYFAKKNPTPSSQN